MMLFLFADLLRKFICFLRVAEGVDPYRFDVYLSFIGSPFDYENSIVFSRVVEGADPYQDGGKPSDTVLLK